MLSHIKAPLREEKRETANRPAEIYQTETHDSSLFMHFLGARNAHPTPEPAKGAGGNRTSGTIFGMTLHAPYPMGRPRRLRRDDFTRNLVREHAVKIGRAHV